MQSLVQRDKIYLASMRISRIFTEQVLTVDQPIILEQQASQHLAKVLRARIGHPVILFNGEGGEYTGYVSAIEKKAVSVQLQTRARSR